MNEELIKKVSAAQNRKDFISIRDWRIPFLKNKLTPEQMLTITNKIKEHFGSGGMNAVAGYIYYSENIPPENYQGGYKNAISKIVDSKKIEDLMDFDFWDKITLKLIELQKISRMIDHKHGIGSTKKIQEYLKKE